MRRRENGAVAFEFLFLFPFIVAILYAAGYYSIVFAWQYQMQNVVDKAVSEALYLDRNTTSTDLATAMQARAQLRLEALVASGLSASVRGKVGAASACTVEVDTLTVVQCRLAMSAETIEGLLPSVSFGLLGEFPPAPPRGIGATAQLAF